MFNVNCKPVSPKLVKQAKRIFVDVTINKHETAWFELTKKSTLEMVADGKDMWCDFDRHNVLWISHAYCQA